jgi:hypothetical protein
MLNIVKANGTVAFSENTNDSKTIVIVPSIALYYTFIIPSLSSQALHDVI